MNLSDFGVSGGPRKTLIILGAGASRGASFVKDLTKPLPPLDLDFFQQLARVAECDESRRLLAFVRSEYQHEVGLSMEQFFSEADYTGRFHRDLNVDRGHLVGRYSRALDDFLSVLPRMLEETANGSCEHHKAVASRLHVQDSIISFNYDCIMDRSLRDFANLKWDPAKGAYGFEVSSGAASWRKHSQGRPSQSSIRLLKMHGSLNWRRRSANAWELVAATSGVTSLKNVIIPPTWFKDLTIFPFNEVWRAARREVRSSRIIVVIGYSVPQTDLFSRSLFKVEAGSKRKREGLDLLVLVNPDERARRLFIELIRGGLEPSTRVLEYRDLEELAALFERYSQDGAQRGAAAGGAPAS